MSEQLLPPQQASPQSDAKQIDPKTVMFVIWALYHMHIITRIQVRDFLDLVKKDKTPPDITEYLIAEVKKI